MGKQMSDVTAAGLGLKSVGKVYHNLSYDELYDHETKNNEGALLPRINILFSRILLRRILPGVISISRLPKKFLMNFTLKLSITCRAKIFMLLMVLPVQIHRRLARSVL